MAEKPLDGSTEKVHLPVASPPRNHGHTTAAWVTVIVIMAGAVVCSLAVMFTMPWLFWTGVGVIVLGLVAGRVLKMLGMGQPEPARGGRSAGHR